MPAAPVIQHAALMRFRYISVSALIMFCVNPLALDHIDRETALTGLLVFG
jgi:hypothetical protein